MLFFAATIAMDDAPQLTRLISVPVQASFPSPGESLTRVVENVSPGFDFHEVIASWNVKNAASAALDVEARARIQGRATKWYRLGSWSLNDRLAPRASYDGQGDADGDVLTDTFRLKQAGQSVDLRLTLRTTAAGPTPKLMLVTLSFLRRGKEPVVPAVASDAWGKVVDVPQVAQGDYPRGGVLCSPTSLTMVLAHYAARTGREELRKDVPEVESMVWDPVYKGAGNWPFNVAYAGSFDPLRAYVSRFQSISDLEKWTAAGFPVICSVSFDLLRGKELSPTEQGHLVVLVGFEKDGTPVFNDPAWKGAVRRTYARADFDRAWQYSARTVYLVYPEGAKVPASTGSWIAD
ncbi:MAG: C39 family peptidase [Fimbriimonas sp.]